MTAAFNVGSGVKETDLVMTRWITLMVKLWVIA